MEIIKYIYFSLLLISLSCAPQSAKDTGPDHLQVAQSFKKPFELTQKDWSTKAHRVVFQNQKTGFIIRGPICDLIGSQAYALMPIQIHHPSANEYKKGIYHDALVPLDSTNCLQTKYAYIDLDSSFQKFGLEITIEKLAMTSDKPSMPLFIPLEPYAYNIGINKGEYINGDEALAFMAFDLFK